MKFYHLLPTTTTILAALLAFSLAGCGGGSGGSTPPPPPTTYTVTSTAGIGTTISPASVTVTAGSTATFTVGLSAGYQNLVAVGCTMSGTACTTGAINANTTVSVSATAIPPKTYTVTATAGLGTTITPASVTVTAGGTATFTVGLLAGYQNLVAVGCTLSGTACTTGAINANTIVSVSATVIPPTIYSASLTSDAHVYVTPASISGVVGQVVNVTVTTDTGVMVKSSTTTGSVMIGTPSGTTYPVTINGNGTVHFLGATSNNAYVLNWMRITPEVLFDDQFATTPITLTVSTYGTIDHILVQWFPDWFDWSVMTVGNGPSGLECLPLKDGGMSGGEHLWTLTFATGVVPTLRYFSGTVDALEFFVDAYDSSGNELSPGDGREFGSGLGMDNQLDLGVVSHSLVTTVTQVASDVFSTSNAVNVVRTYSASEGNGYSTTVSRVLAVYGDVSRVIAKFDFGRTRDGNIPSGGPYGAQPVSGIGSSVSTPTTTLASVILETPSDILGTATLHELGHSFLCYMQSASLPLCDLGHTTISTLTPGQMSRSDSILMPQSGGGFEIIPEMGGGDNKQNVCRNYSPLELHSIFGTAPSTVQPGLYLDPTYVLSQGLPVPNSAVFSAAGSDVVATYGNWSSLTPNNYKFPTLFVGLSEQPMTAAEMAFLNRIAVYFASQEVDTAFNTQGVFPVCSTPSFTVATGALGIMTTTIPAPK